MSLKAKNKSLDKLHLFSITRQELLQPFEIILVFDLHVLWLLHDLNSRSAKMLRVSQLPSNQGLHEKILLMDMDRHLNSFAAAQRATHEA